MGLKSLNSKTLVTASTVPFFIIYGAEGEGDDGDKSGKAGAGGKTDTKGKTGDEKDADEDEDEEIDPKDAQIRDLSAEARKRRLANKATERERDQLKAQIEARDRKDKTDLENATSDNAKRDEKSAKMESTLRANLLETAILRETKYTWHDASDLHNALDMDQIDIDVEAGSVEGLADELKRVAKDKPYLLKSGKKDGDDDKEVKKNGPSGQNPGGAGSRAAAEKASDREYLINKYRL